jgi:iron complex transport system substrate-binding protein
VKASEYSRCRPLGLTLPPRRIPLGRHSPMKKFLLLLALLGSCGESTSKGPLGAQANPLRFPSLSSEQGFPLTITHPDGRESVLTRAPKKVLPGNSGCVDFLSLILEADQIAALPKGTEAYSRLRTLSAGPWLELPVFQRYTAEEILAHDPDLVLTSDWQNPESNQILERNGVLVLSLPSPRSWAEVLRELELLGRITGSEERSRALHAQLEQRRMALQEHSEFRSELSVLAYSNFGGGGFTSGSGTTMDLMLSLAGMRNAATDAGLRGECSLDFEQLLTIDPDFILVSASASEPSPSAELLSSRSELAGLHALQNGRILYLHKALFSSTSTELISAAEALQVEITQALAKSK